MWVEKYFKKSFWRGKNFQKQNGIRLSPPVPYKFHLSSLVGSEFERWSKKGGDDSLLRPTCFSDSADLVVSVLEAKDLVAPDSNGSIDTYVRVYLLPDKTTNMQTRVSTEVVKELAVRFGAIMALTGRLTSPGMWWHLV